MNNEQFLKVIATLSDVISQKDEEIADLRDSLEIAEEGAQSMKWYRGEWERYAKLYEDAMQQLNQLGALVTREQAEERRHKASIWMAETGKHMMYSEADLSAPYPCLKSSVGKPNRIGMIKGLRPLTGWGLKEAKDFVDQWLTDAGIALS